MYAKLLGNVQTNILTSKPCCGSVAVRSSFRNWWSKLVVDPPSSIDSNMFRNLSASAAAGHVAEIAWEGVVVFDAANKKMEVMECLTK